MPASSANGEALAAEVAVGCGFRTSFEISTLCAGEKTVGGVVTAGGAVCPDADAAAALAALGVGACGAITGAGGAACTGATTETVATAGSGLRGSGSGTGAAFRKSSPNDSSRSA